MKLRTVEELHDSKIGHKKFAKICDSLILKGYRIAEIKEYYEFFKFKINDKQFWFYKDWKMSAEEFVKETERWYNQCLELERLQNLK